MLIRGIKNPRQILRTCVSYEYAFFFIWPDEKEVKIGHSKGRWTVFKKTQSGETDYFTLDDDGTVGAENSFTNGFIQTIVEKEPEITGKYADRVWIAVILVNGILPIWGGKLEDIKNITVFQEGRNSVVEPDGNLVLSPIVREWKK